MRLSKHARELLAYQAEMLVGGIFVGAWDNPTMSLCGILLIVASGVSTYLLARRYLQ